MLVYIFAGQGSQYKGMGKGLFEAFPELMAIAYDVLGYSIKEICMDNYNGRLYETEYAQPAIFTVNAFKYLKTLEETGRIPDFVLGHSLGEYSALFAAGVFDFKTGLEIVLKRGQLMGAVNNGAMAAVVGLTPEETARIIKEEKLDAIDIANINAPNQVVITGPEEILKTVQPIFMKKGAQRYIVLNVSGAFHSRYMEQASKRFGKFLRKKTFIKPSIPVISNTYARPYKEREIAQTLEAQMRKPVQWVESVRYLMRQGTFKAEQMGLGTSMLKLVNEIVSVQVPKDSNINNKLWEMCRRGITGAAEKKVLHFVDTQGKAFSLTGKAVLSEALSAGTRIQALPKGAKTVFLMPQSTEYICTLLGCFYAGVVALPTALIDDKTCEQQMDKVVTIIKDSGAQGILTTHLFRGYIETIKKEVGPINVFYMDEPIQECTALLPPREVEAEDLAMLLYTSGSTSAPKGVALTYDHLWFIAEISAKRFGMNADSRIVSWMPLYHCFGLIINVLAPMYAGADVFVSEPKSFIENPAQWLRNISNFKATHTAAPNFAFDHCINHIQMADCDDLSLKSLKAIICGGEPVQKSTYEAFIEKFQSLSLEREVFSPHYGLSEVGCVSCKPLEEPLEFLYVDIEKLHEGQLVRVDEAKEGKWITSCGTVEAPVSIAIVNPKTLTPVDEGQMGEIWLRSPSLASEYYNKAEETKYAFKAVLAGEETDYFRTGDLGLMMNKQLYVSGRLKEVMIINGKNYFPNDIEMTLKEAFPEEKGTTAVFSYESKFKEKVVVVQEISSRTDAEYAETAERIFSAVAKKHQITVDTLVFTEPGSISKTGSGKVSRKSCKNLYLKSEMPIICTFTHTTVGQQFALPQNQLVFENGQQQEIAVAIVEFLCGELKMQLTREEKNNFMYRAPAVLGLSSLELMRLVNTLEEQYKSQITIKEILEAGSIKELAQIAERQSCIQSNSKIDECYKLTDSRSILLTEGQKGLWMIQKTYPRDTSYNVPVCLRFKEKNVDRRKLKEAIDHVTLKHPLLHSVVKQENGDLFLECQPIERMDYSEIRVEERETKACIETETMKPFSMGTDPLMRITVIEESAGDVWLLMVIHHIVFDGKSMTILLKDLLEAYKHRCLGKELKQAHIDLQKYYKHYKKEQDLISGYKGKTMMDYWNAQLTEPLPLFELPKDQNARRGAESNNGIWSYPLAKEIFSSVKEYAASNEIHLSTLFLAAYQILLFVHTGQRETVIGMPVMQRHSKTLDDTVGYFVNMMPIRGRVEPHEDSVGHLEKVQQLIIEGLDHSAYPFPAIVRNIESVARGDGRHPVFQTSFAYQNFYEAYDIKTLEEAYREFTAFEIVESICQGSDFDFMMEVNEKPNEISICMKYHTEDYKISTVRNLMEKYIRIVEGLLNSESIQAIESACAVSVYEDLSNTIHGLFEKQVGKSAKNTAVVDSYGAVSYRELSVQSEDVAVCLKKLEVKKGDAVGICMERSAGWIIGMLGIMKCGAVYVPLDYQYPKERIQYMIKDSRLKLILSDETARRDMDQSVLEIVDTLDIGKVLKRPVKEGERKALKETEVDPCDAAYIIYTSGSTGNPKGVVVEHRGIVSMKTYLEDNRIMEEHDRITQFSSMSFDASLLEVFGTLLTGAALYILPRSCIDDIRLYEKYLNQNQIIGTFATPAYLASVNPENVKTARKIMSGGAAASYGIINKWHQKADYINLYGPTEDTIVTTGWICRKTDELPASGNAPIGEVLPFKTVYIVGENNTVMSDNEVGELCVAGIGLAREYLNNSKLTSQKFVSNPFSEEGKMYKTGDLAYRDNDGVFYYVGRIDTQIKYHGYRIELGEIEEKIRSFEGTSDCAVILQKQHEIERLIAFLVMEEGTKYRDEELKEYLKTVLPAYMIPVFFIKIDQLPLAINGKVDRNKLMANEIEVNKERPVAEPEKQEEKILLKIWQNVLKIENICTQDVFFEIGGDSILAVQLADEIGRQIGIEVPITLIFKYPSIEKFGAYLEEIQAAKTLGHEELTTVLQTEEDKDIKDDDSAIIGISFNIPDAENMQELWENLKLGRESVKYYSEEELRAMGLPEQLISHPQYMPVKAGIRGAELFDSNFFKLSPRDARNMGCEARLLLTHAYMAVQDAGYVPEAIPDTAVFMSTSHTPLIAPQDQNDYSAQTLAAKGTVSTMVSYKLGLTGPSLYLHSNCSSTLANLHLACHALKNGDAAYALVGGCCVAENEVGYIHKTGMNHSYTGKIRAFDADADGIVGGDGVVVFLIKRAKEAIRDGDPVYALIKGSAVNNDGSEKVGFYAPSVNGQSQVIEKALKRAGVHPDTIDYVEAHGTGTKIGDPIEVEALTEVYQRYTSRKQFCGIGSIKSNIGHLDTAAGLAGCLKVVVCMNQKMLPPSINYKKPNPSIDFKNSPFSVTKRLMPWEKKEGPRRAAVSSFGIGGTNVHVVLEEYVAERGKNTGCELEYYMIPVSADNQILLKKNVEKLLMFVEEQGEMLCLADFAYTMQTGRKALKERQIFTVGTTDELITQMAAFSNQG